MAECAKPRLAQLDGLRGPLSLGVIAINMDLYNAGANTPVGFFLVLSGLTAYVAYGADEWDAADKAHFFRRRLVRLLPMLLISVVWQQCTSALWLFRRGVTIPGLSSGGPFSFVINGLALLLVLAGSGILCRGSACGCCQISAWPRPPCALLPLVVGAYLVAPGWYVGLLLLLNAYFLPKLLERYGAAWKASPPSWPSLLGWASLEALVFMVPLALYQMTHSAGLWYGATLYVYLGAPPLFRLSTFVFGMQLGRYAVFEARNQTRSGEHRLLSEARTLIPALVTVAVVTRLHGFLRPESDMHDPNTGCTPLQWLLIHLIHPFNVLALVIGLISAPTSLVARLLASRPLLLLAELSYAVYLLHYGLLTAYAFALRKSWGSGWEPLVAAPDAPPLGSLDYYIVVLLSIGLAYPTTRWLEPRVARWLEARLEPAGGLL